MTFHHILMMNIDGFTRFTPCCRVHVRCDPFAEHKEPCRFVDYIVVKVEGSQKEMLCESALFLPAGLARLSVFRLG